MKLLHLADTHLGYASYRKLSDDGINQRELDIYNAFTQCIDYVLQHKPDLILHAGDLFDSVRPTNRAITVAMEQLIRLEKAHIPCIIISGNHETPRLKETGHIFSIFNHLPNITLVYKNHYECHHYTFQDTTLAIHALPQCNSKEEYEHELSEIQPDKQVDYNILLAHGAVTDIKEFRMNEFNELMIPIQQLTSQYDYIALGHYHKYVPLTQNTYYAGSPERLSFSEAPDIKGFIEITTKKNLTTQFIPTTTRPMYDLPPINCTNCSLESIQTTIKKQLQTINTQEAIVRLNLHHIPTPIYRALDFPTIRNQARHSLHFEIKTSLIQTPNLNLPQKQQLQSLAHEFHNYLNQQNIENKKIIEKLGLEYLTKCENNLENI